MGFCVGNGHRLPTAGTWLLKQTGDNLGRMLAQVADNLEDHIEIYRPDEVGYEEPILIFNQRYKDKNGEWRKRNDTLVTLRKTIPLGARVEEVCYRRGISCTKHSIAGVKKELGGFADASKDDLVFAAEKLGITLPSGEAKKDAADATGGWLLLLRLRSRALSMPFDQALWGQRRAFLI